MTGFESPNYTQIPNDLLGNFSDVGLMADMGLAELKVLLALCRLTFGYHRDEVDTSLSVLERMTGLSRPSVIEGAKALVKRGIVDKHLGDKGVTHWLVNVTSKEALPDNDETSKEALPPTSKEDLPYKERIERKETKDTSADKNQQPANFQQWLDLLKESKNRIGTLGRMAIALYDTYDDNGHSPNYGFLGRLAKKHSASYIAKLLWDNASRPPVGDPIQYIAGILKKPKRSRYTKPEESYQRHYDANRPTEYDDIPM